MNEIISINPATLEPLGRAPVTSSSKVKELVAAARAAQPSWARLTPHERIQYIARAREHVVENADHIAKSITRDNGKPLVESMSQEVYPVAQQLAYLARNAPRMLRGARLKLGAAGLMGRSSRLERRPLGVVGIITPWNYPFAIAMGQAAQALAAGNAVLLKPSSATATIGALIEEAFRAAGVPQGVFTHLPGDAETGRALAHAKVDKIAFTGSVGTGKDVMHAAAAHPTPLLMELGGVDPMIARADCNMERTTSAAVWGAFTNCGQACASVERCYVHESIFDEFVEICVRKALALKVGNGLDPDVEVGPMTTLAQLEHVEAQIIDARARGATVHCGGERDASRVGFFLPPTVITGVDHSFPIVRDETSGPVLPIMPFHDDMQAVRLANDIAFGLTASVWSKDQGAARSMAREISAGTVMINECVYTHALPGTPWGGVKRSGFGRTHGMLGLWEFTQPTHHHACRDPREDVWWFGYDLGLYESFAELMRRSAGGLLDVVRGGLGLMKLRRRGRR